MIEGIFHISETDSKSFTQSLIQVIAELQVKKFMVEIQYSTSTKGSLGQVVFNALVVGRQSK